MLRKKVEFYQWVVSQTQSCPIKSEWIYKGNLCRVDVSHAWHGSCVTVKSPASLNPTGLDERGWQQNLHIHKLQCSCAHCSLWICRCNTLWLRANFNFDLTQRQMGVNPQLPWGMNNDVRQIGEREEEGRRENICHDSHAGFSWRPSRDNKCVLRKHFHFLRLHILDNNYAGKTTSTTTYSKTQ